MKSRSTLTALLVGLCPLACAHTESSGPSQEMVVRMPGYSSSFEVYADHYEGISLQVDHEKDELRGQSSLGAIDLDVRGFSISGLIGSGETNLYLNLVGDQVQTKGTFHGILTQWVWSPQVLAGQVGRCAYDMKSEGQGHYVGEILCGNGHEIGPQRGSIDLPAALSQKPLAERVVMVALLLDSAIGNGSGRMAGPARANNRTPSTLNAGYHPSVGATPKSPRS